jgi:AcrR family transcriptional regulator
VSIRNIAARVEYSPGAIYGYFASKDEIFYALAEEGLRDLGARELADAPSADPSRTCARRVAALRVQQGAAAVLRAGVPGPPRAAREQGVRALRVHLRDAQPRAGARRALHRRGLFPETTHAEVALRLLWAPIVGFAALRLSHRIPDSVDIDPLVRDAIETTIAGIRAGAPRHARRSRPPPRDAGRSEAAAV